MSLKAPNPNKSKLVRKPSPDRPEAEDTFRRKLEEIKKIRQKQNNNAGNNQASVRKKVVVNGKPALDVQGDWALFSSSSGKKYFFNLKTLVNQWTKPPGWIEEGQIQPPLPPSSKPPLPNDQNGSSNSTNGSGANKNPGFKMKIKKGSSKVKKKKNQGVLAPSAQPPLPPPPENDTVKNNLPKAYMDFSDDEDESKSKLPKLDDDDYKDLSCLDYKDVMEPDTSAKMSSNSPPQPPSSHPGSAPVPVEPVPSLPDPQLQAVLAAKAMIESQLPPPSATTGKNSTY